MLQLGEKIAATMPNVETKYYDYRTDEVPDALDTIINSKQLSLPAVFINGKASFAGGLPGFYDLLTSIQKKLAK